MNLENILRIFIGLTCLAGLIGWRGNTKYIRLIIILVFITFAVELVAAYFDNIRKQKPINFIYFFYANTEILITSFVFISQLKKTIFKKSMIIIAFIALAIIWYYLLNIPLNQLMTKVIFINGLWILFLVLSYFYQLLKDDEYVRLTTVSLFWISLGLFIYFTTTLLLHKTIGYLYEIDVALADKTFIWISSISNIIMYILFSIGFVCQIYPKKKKPFLQ